MTVDVCDRTVSGAHHMVVLAERRDSGNRYLFGECACCGHDMLRIVSDKPAAERTVESEQ